LAILMAKEEVKRSGSTGDGVSDSEEEKRKASTGNTL
jgi:hypothetical protein